MTKCLCGCGKEVKKGNKYINHHNTRKWKDKTYKEMYGEKRAKEIIEKMSGHHDFGDNPWWETPEGKQSLKDRGRKISIAKKGKPSKLKGRTYVEIHGAKKAKKIILNKKIGPHKSGWKLAPRSKEYIQKQIKSKTGHIVTKETRKKLCKARKGKSFEKLFGVENAKITKKKMSNTRTKMVISGDKFCNNGKFKTGWYILKNGRRVFYRSGWESLVMKYFDKNNIEWIYETEQNRFYLSSINKYYVNDFYLPKENKYIQVKGYLRSNDKYHLFKKENPNLNIELWDVTVLKEKGIV